MIDETLKVVTVNSDTQNRIARITFYKIKIA